MGQMGFFDIAQRYAGLDAKNDPLVKIDEVVPWQDFRPRRTKKPNIRGVYKDNYLCNQIYIKSESNIIQI